jgi:hypothetical protein
MPVVTTTRLTPALVVIQQIIMVQPILHTVLHNSQRIVSPVIQKPPGNHPLLTTTASISRFIPANTRASGQNVLIVTLSQPIIRFSRVSIVMSTTKRIWTMNTEEKTVMYITVPIVMLVIQKAIVNEF